MTASDRIGRIGRVVEAVGAFGGRPAVIHGLLLAAVIFAAYVGWQASFDSATAWDARVYYDAAALDDPYRATIVAGGFGNVGGLHEYKYPPPLAQVLAPLRFIPWPAFVTLWVLLNFGVFLRLAGRWSLALLLGFPVVIGELWLANINILLGAAVLVGFRRPAAWAFPILTKLTLGVGLLWFAVRREWRQLALALGATAAVGLVSYVLAPDLWADFVTASTTQTGPSVAAPEGAVPIGLPIRLAAAAVLIAWGARHDRRWVLPVGVALASPFLWWNVLAMLVACVPLLDPDARVSLLPARRRAPAEVPA
jgi:hypothetical protein